METNISIRIYMNHAPDRWLHQVLKIEAVSHCDSARQIDVEVITALPKACADKDCHEDGPHLHETISTEAIRAEDVMENCGSCDQQGIGEHCIEHHDLAQGTSFAKCQEGC